jgi:hypothetical protein
MDRAVIRVRIAEVQYLLHHHPCLPLPTILLTAAKGEAMAEMVVASVTGLNVNLMPLSIRGIISVARMGREAVCSPTTSMEEMEMEVRVFL